MPLFTLFTSFARSRVQGLHCATLSASFLMVVSIPLSLIILRICGVIRHGGIR